MRIPVGRHVLVTLTVVGALLTGVVAVGLMNPALVPGMAGDQHDSDAASGAPASLSVPQQQPAPEIVTIVITPEPSTSSSMGSPQVIEADGQPSTTSQPPTAQPVRLQAVPTPNPDFTPAVQQQPASGRYEENEHEGYDDDDEEYEDEGYEDEHDEGEDD